MTCDIFRQKRIAISIVALGTAIAGGIMYQGNPLGVLGECKTVVHRSILSPNGKKSLVVFERTCGATTGFNTQMSIAPTSALFAPSKNPAFFVTSGLHDVTARWLDDGAVEIAVIPGGGNVFRSERSVGDTRIIYR